jgi:hypothetical protein
MRHLCPKKGSGVLDQQIDGVFESTKTPDPFFVGSSV